MENRFLEMDKYLKQCCEKKGRHSNMAVQQSNYSFAQNPALIPIATTILGTTMTRVLNNTGDISWELDQLSGLKHPDNKSSTPGPSAYTSKKILINGPVLTIGFAVTDEIYVKCEIDFDYNGHSLGNVQVAIVSTEDAVGWGLIVKETIMDDANTYVTSSSPVRFAAIKLRIQYNFTSSLRNDSIYIDDIKLYGNGTYDFKRRKTQ